jgi:indole-3-glycerol phosphate synthase
MADIFEVSKGYGKFLARLEVLGLRVLVDMDIEDELDVATRVRALVLATHNENLPVRGHCGGAFTQEEVGAVFQMEGLDILETGFVKLEMLVVEATVTDNVSILEEFVYVEDKDVT